MMEERGVQTLSRFDECLSPEAIRPARRRFNPSTTACFELTRFHLLLQALTPRMVAGRSIISGVG